jgi:hypothetical protein
LGDIFEVNAGFLVKFGEHFQFLTEKLPKFWTSKKSWQNNSLKKKLRLKIWHRRKLIDVMKFLSHLSA